MDASTKQFKGYVLREELKKELDSEKSLEHICHDIHYSKLISSSTPVIIGLKKIINSKFLYVLEQNEICGLVTYSDFDKRPVRLLLYLLFGQMESNLLSAMKEAHNDVYWMSKLTKSESGKIEYYFSERQKKDSELRKIECFGLGEIFHAIKDDPDWRQKLGLDRYDYDRLTERFVELRNEVSHQGLDIALSPSSLEDVLDTKDKLLEIVKRSEFLSNH